MTHYLVRSKANPANIYCTDGEFHHESLCRRGQFSARLYKSKRGASAVRNGEVSVHACDDLGVESKKLRVWWIPQVPGKAFRIEVQSVEEAVKIRNVLALYDLFQYENQIKPDYCNAGGLEVLEDGEWYEWHNSDGDCIDDVMRNVEESK